jgi:hypothetical protein
MSRRLAAIAIAVAAALVPAATAAGYWSAPGAGIGAGSTGGLDQVAGLTVSVAGTVAVGTFDVAWTPLGLPAGVTPAYVVERRVGTTTTTVCTTTSPRCTLTGLPDGTATYRVSARLNAWSGAVSIASPAIKVLSAPPTIASGPPAHIRSPKAGFTFAESPYTAFLCRLDGGADAPCTSPFEYVGLAPGPHTFEVRAVDAYGSATQPATWSWTADP